MATQGCRCPTVANDVGSQFGREMQTHAEVFQVAIEDRQTVFVLRMGRRAGGEYREEVGARGCRRGVFADDLPHPGGDFHADLDSCLAAVIDQLLAPDIVACQIRHIDKGHPAGQEAERRQVHCQLLLGAQDGGGERGHPLHQGGGDGTLGRRLAAELQVQERVNDLWLFLLPESPTSKTSKVPNKTEQRY